MAARNRRMPVCAALSLIGATLVLTGCSAAIMAPDGRSLYWGKNSSDTPYRVDTATEVTTTLPAPTTYNLRAGLIAPSGASGYVVNANGELSHLSTQGALLEPPLPLALPLFATSTVASAMSPDGANAVIGSDNNVAAGLTRVDLTSTPMRIAASATVPDATNGFADTAAFTPDGAAVLVALRKPPFSPIPAYVIKVRTSDLAETTSRLALNDIGDVAGVILAPDGGTGYAIGNLGIVRFDPATLTATGTLLYAGEIDVQENSLMSPPGGERLYFLDQSTTAVLHTVDLTTFTELAPQTVTALTGSLYWGALSPDGTTLYLGTDADGYVTKLAVAALRALQVGVSGPGSVRASTAATSCTASCDYSVLDYRTVTLTATPNPGATFTGWGGACSGTESTCTLPMASARSVTAAFVPPNRITGLRTTTRIGSAGITFTTTLRVPGPGRVAQSISLASRLRRSAPQVICRTTARPTAARTVTLRCEAGARVRAGLARQRLELRVTTTFRPDGGIAASTVRVLRLARTPLVTSPPVTG